MSETLRRLVAKLAEVMAAVERIPKRGWNDFHKYHFATEADIAEALRNELASRKVLLIPGITGMEREKVGDKGSSLTTLFMTMTFMDAETGESIERPWLGAGTDKEDKGAYKAITGGEKYFLLKTFLIPTGDDPEAEAHTAPPPAPRQQAAPTQTPSAPQAEVKRSLPPFAPVKPPAPAQTPRPGPAPVKPPPQRATGHINDSDIPF